MIGLSEAVYYPDSVGRRIAILPKQPIRRERTDLYMTISPTIDLDSIITAIATVFTAAAAWAAVKTVSTQTSPDVIAYPEAYPESPDWIRLVFRNIGHAPAYDVRISLSKDVVLDGEEKIMAKKFCDAGIEMLAPGQSYDFLLGRCTELSKRWGCQSDTPLVRLVYFGKVNKKKVGTRDHFGKGWQYRGIFPLDLSPFFGHTTIKVTTPEETRFQNALRAVIKLPKETEALRKTLEGWKASDA